MPWEALRINALHPLQIIRSVSCHHEVHSLEIDDICACPGAVV